MNSELLLLLAVIVVGFVAWRFIRNRRQSQVENISDKEPSASTPAPSITVIQASDASGSSGRLSSILQNLESEQRIRGYATWDAGEDLSSLKQTVREEDLILIVLTSQLESQKEQIETLVETLQAKVAEIIVDNVVYDNTFITFPRDLRPINDRQDPDGAWSGIEQTLKEMFPVQKNQAPAPGPKTGNKRLEAVKNHPEYPELLKRKPSSSRVYGRYGCTVIFGLIVALGTLFINFIPGPPGGHPWYFRLILSIFTFLGVGLVGYGIYRFIKLSSTRLRRLPALIIDKRTSVSGGSGSSSASTYYYVTLEFEDGEREELKSSGKLYGKITKDDVGVAYILEQDLLDYRRLAV